MHKKMLLVESSLVLTITTMISTTKTLPNESALKTDALTVLMVYEMLLFHRIDSYVDFQFIYYATCKFHMCK